MTIEAQLEKTNELLQGILTALSSNAAVSAPAAEPVAPKRTRKAAEPAPAQEPAADPKPQPEQAPEAAPATTAPTPAATEPSATPEPATASDAPSVPFADVVAAIKTLNETLNAQSPGKGREAVLKVIGKFLGSTEGKRVPDLEAVGKNAEIVAYAKELLVADADDLGV